MPTDPPATDPGYVRVAALTPAGDEADPNVFVNAAAVALVRPCPDGPPGRWEVRTADGVSMAVGEDDARGVVAATGGRLVRATESERGGEVFLDPATIRSVWVLGGAELADVWLAGGVRVTLPLPEAQSLAARGAC